MKDEISNQRDAYRAEFKKRLKLLIYEKCKDSIVVFADLIGESEFTVRKWTDLQSSVPSPHKISNICEKTGTSADWLLRGSGGMDNITVSRSDLIFSLWISLWEQFPVFCDKHILEMHRIIMRRTIDDKIKNSTRKDPDAENLINEAYTEWDNNLCQVVDDYRAIELYNKKVYETVDGNWVRKTKEHDGKIFYEELPEKEKEIVDFSFEESSRLHAKMLEAKKEINTLLKLY